MSRACTSILLVEDNRGDARLILEMFREVGSLDVEMTQVESLAEAETHLAANVVDAILLDLGLSDVHGLEAVQRAHAAAPKTPLLVLTGLDDESLAIQTLQQGAQDYLIKGQIEARGLTRALRYAIERKSMEEALFVETQRAQATLACIADAVICTNQLGEVTFLNAVAEAMTGWSCQQARGLPIAKVVHVLDVATRAPVCIGFEPMARRATCVLVRLDGLETAIEDSIAPIHDRDGHLGGAVIVFRDVSVARAMSSAMIHSAQHDFLTELPNRLLLKDRVTHAIVLAQRHNEQVAVLYLDLDGFKHINDSLGHAVGDKLLQSVAKRLTGCTRSTDTVSRRGGDEFVVLLSELKRPKDASISAARMLATVADPHTIDDHELHITTSIGISVYPEDALDAETLIKNADTAMYQAKENGRARYQYFEPAMNAQAVERQSIEEALRSALARNELSLHYQPKIDLGTGTITGAEALLRWTHPTRGRVSPAEFIPVAEDCGLIVPIGNWVMREACRQARAWSDAGLPRLTMAVNVSAKEFRNDTFLNGLFAILGDTACDPAALEIELTESVLMKNAESAAGILRTLRHTGVQIAVDDFGTGYSSLSYLRKFPIDALKIDQSFVAEITENGDDVGIVTAVISMARSLKLRVVAEGVETHLQMAFLRSQQCDEGQGYFWGRPVVPEQFAQLFETRLVS